jgi:hypothetical protein
MDVRKVTADGNCMFRAATVASSKDAFYHMSPEVERETARKLRLDVVKFISEHETEFKPYMDLEDQSFEEYTERMKGVAWGGEPELCAIAEVKKCPVHVFEQNGDRFQVYRSYTPTIRSDTASEICILFDFDLRHYNALLRE